ncbi:hypothetical protein Syun_031686 [Stephania yunnanensis]|uniref:Uncharacterized protein n=1 Tax=Stephania yunnanensis TaxID=152371 RepID=A0AAP0HAZ7_9MAGN
MPDINEKGRPIERGTQVGHWQMVDPTETDCLSYVKTTKKENRGLRPSRRFGRIPLRPLKVTISQWEVYDLDLVQQKLLNSMARAELSKAQHQLAFHTHDDKRREELKAFDDTKAGVKGLVDAGVTKIPRIFIDPPGYGDHHDYNENKLVLSGIDGADDDQK